MGPMIEPSNVNPCAECEALLRHPNVCALPANLRRTSPMSAGSEEQVPPPVLECVNCGSVWGWTRARGVFRHPA